MLWLEMDLPDPFCRSTPDFMEGWPRPREGKLLLQGPTEPLRQPGSFAKKRSSKAQPKTPLRCWPCVPCPVFLGMRAGVSDEDFMTSFQIMQLVGYSLPGGCLNLNEVGWGGW